ncbi:hypothetical protein D0T53_01110 [Dysgonomonas sp. 216]|uniref:hypothetical protein n=1 Tax=Dysgonomonas sp. 216 TaxID=2302934 RepID=UPI0013D535EA|nr:hypothetical protein [Dysgonomonas sp. 216]NDW17512.1 hypothetical protein [Dysgonomonas sp. 216]
MSDNLCPLCGKQVNENEIICSECNEIARRRDSINFLLDEDTFNTDMTEDTPPIIEKNTPDRSKNNTIPDKKNILPEDSENEKEIPPTPPAKNIGKKIRIIALWSVGLLLCLGMGIGIYLVNKEKKDRDNAELSFWYMCIERNTPETYSNYLRLYPNGKFQNEAQDKIGRLRDLETKAWLGIKNSSDINDFYDFLQVYPLTPFKTEAKKIMDSLSWNEAQVDNTAEGYLVYIQNAELGNIAGFYKDIAQNRHDYLFNIKPVEGDERNDIMQHVGSLFRSLSGNQFRKLTDILNIPKVDNFYGAKNRSGAIIVKSIEADMQRNKIKSMEYYPQYKTLTVEKDGDGIYLLSLTVDKKIYYKTHKKNDNITEKLYIELTPDKKVKYLHTSKDGI